MLSLWQLVCIASARGVFSPPPANTSASRASPIRRILPWVCPGTSRFPTTLSCTLRRTCPLFLPSEVEQFPQAAGLGAAHRNLCLLLIVHAQLVGAFEPGHDLADVI